MNNFYHPGPSINDWLSPLDTLLCHKINQFCSSKKILEIGVWKGAFLFSQLVNDNDRIAVGIDSYPGLGKIRKRLVSDIHRFNFSEKFFLFNNYLKFCKSNIENSFGLCHIDGEHTQQAVAFDLELAAKYLDEGGIIVIDDVYQINFTGIAPSVFEFLRTKEFASFLVTSSKIYICRKNMYKYFFTKTQQMLKNEGLHSLYSTKFFSKIIKGNIRENNSIYGYKQIVIHNYQVEKYLNYIIFE